MSSRARRPGAAALALAATAVLASGCGVKMVRQPGAVAGCTKLADIETRAPWGGFAWLDTTLKGNERRLARQALGLGGDTVLIVEEEGRLMPRTAGVAYRCGPAPPPARAPERPGA